jgi:N-acetylglucosamine kinase-like BadF-type ATPase
VIYLGIDGGGSKTKFLLEDETGNPIQNFETGPSNWLSAGAERSRQSIADGISELTQIPNIVCGGFAGAGRPEGIDFFSKCLHDLLPAAKVLVETDAFVAYTGAIGLEPGVLLIAGTGSIAIGRRADGEMIRVGGWGPIFSDEGSGFWIGREAIRFALRAHDRPDSEAQPFLQAIVSALQLDSILDISAAWKSGAISVQSVASLASVLFETLPNEPAASILEEAALNLRRLTQDAIARVGTPNCRLSISGSIGNHPFIQRKMGISFRKPANTPERGAIIWARSQARR